MGKSPLQNRNSQWLGIIRQYWHLLIIGILFIIVQWPIFTDWWKIWNEKDGYYSHGPLVPFIAAFMLWTNRKILAATTIKPSWYGLLLLAAAVPVYSVAMLMELRVLYMFAFFIILFGLILLFFGWRITKVVAVPILFLVTMMPIASGILDNLTGRAQLLSATVAAKILQWTGYEVVQYGNIIRSNDLPHALLVGSPCSGLRLMISLLTFSWFFTYIVNAARWKKLVLLILTFPLAVFINSLRITMIGYVGFWIGTAEAMSTFHDYSGYIGLIVCFFILFGIAKLLKCERLDSERQPDSIGQMKTITGKVYGSARFLVSVLILACLAYIGNIVQPLYNLPKGKLDRACIPMRFGNWVGHDVPIDGETRRILDKGDLLSRVYTDDTGRQVHVFLDAACDISAFHDPHLCLTGGGNPIEKESQLNLYITNPYRSKLNATIFEIAQDYSTGLVLHWYMLNKASYSQTGDIARIHRHLMVQDLKDLVFSPTSINRLRKKIRVRQFTWYRFSTDKLSEDDSDAQFIKSFAREFIRNKRDFGK